MMIFEAQKSHIFKNFGCFSQLKMCCDTSFDFRKFSIQNYASVLNVIDWIDQEDYFCNLFCDNERSRKFSKAE